MTEKTYAEKILELADQIRAKAQQIKDAERSRHSWTRPDGNTIHLGAQSNLVRPDGTVTPGMEGIHREILAALDAKLFRLYGELEGLRFKLARLGREGGAA